MSRITKITRENAISLYKVTTDAVAYNSGMVQFQAVIRNQDCKEIIWKLQI